MQGNGSHVKGGKKVCLCDTIVSEGVVKLEKEVSFEFKSTF